MSVIINSVVETHVLHCGGQVVETAKVTCLAVDRKVTFSGHFLVDVGGAYYLVSGSDINPHETDFMVRFNGGRGGGVTNVSVVLGKADDVVTKDEVVYEGYVVEPMYSINYTENGGYYGRGLRKEVEHITSTLRKALRNLEEDESSLEIVRDE